jgi:DNA topoisomerase-1
MVGSLERSMVDAEVSGAQPIDSPVQCARAVGLRYVSDQMPGIRRRKLVGGFLYTYATGQPVREQAILGRIKSLR